MKELVTNMIFRLFKKRCKHSWISYSIAHIKCEKCEKIEYNPSEAARLNNEVVDMMIHKGFWKKEDIPYRF